MNSRARWLLTFLASALVAAVLVVAPVTPAAAELHGIRGTYGEIRRGDGHVDTPATIDRLRALNANTYLYFIDGQQDWDDLRFEFAAAAQAAGINVWIYLHSPSNCRDSSCDYLPYRHRYEDWACAIAQLSRQYPAVAAWVIDDFATNTDYITPSYLREIRRLSNSIQPTLKFYPVVYFNRLGRAVSGPVRNAG